MNLGVKLERDLRAKKSITSVLFVPSIVLRELGVNSN